MAKLKLVAGLGNPGSKYEETRHNVGFALIDRLAEGGSGTTFSRKFDGLVADVEIDFHRVLLLKPMTFMNESGRSLSQVMRFYQLEPSDVLVVCDDLSLPLGKLRARASGSDGGQKGLRSIIQHLGTQDVPRLRIGIGQNVDAPAERYVLDPFRHAEKPIIGDALILASQAVAVWASQGLGVMMNRFNSAPTAL